jgi:hypothetical protein
MPNCPDLTGGGRLEKNNLLLGDRIPRIRASRCALGGKDRGPVVTRCYPSRGQLAIKRLICDDLATRADEEIAVRALQAIVWCTSR